MSEYSLSVETMECDYYRFLPPKQILEHCLSITLQDQRRDGCGLERLESELNAVWMISSMRYEQFAPIVPCDELVFHTFPRVEKRSCYLYEVTATRNGEPILHFLTNYIPVDWGSRHLLRLSALSPLWNSPAGESSSHLHRLRPDCEFIPCGSDTVRLSDCDKNHHMTSGAYLSMACNALGYWESETPRLMKMMQVDFTSEVRPGTQLRFERGEADGLHYVRGLKPDGSISFTAACDY